MSSSPAAQTSSTPSRTIRDILMTYGVNGGKRLTDEELVKLIALETQTLSLPHRLKLIAHLKSPDMLSEDQYTSMLEETLRKN